MARALKTLVLGAGDRGRSWMRNAKKAEAGFKPIAIADPSEKARLEYMNEFGTVIQTYNYAHEALEDKNALDYEAVIIATPDKTHRDLAVKALEKGYNVLLEKPMATTIQGCRDVVAAQEKSGKTLAVAHVLRYSKFFEELYLANLGELFSINLTENVGHWHFPHSYVRGNWSRRDESGPVLLTKSCHDMDILKWLAGSKAKTVFSIGSLDYFTPENAPEGAGEDCFDCAAKFCMFDALEFYVGDHILKKDGTVGHPYRVVSQSKDPHERLAALVNSQYAECVFNGNNDVCDNQDVLIEFENGVKANFSLRWGGEFATRKIHMHFEYGEVIGDLDKGEIEVTEYKGIRGQGSVIKKTLESKGGHGGGDGNLIKNFEELIRTGDSTLNRTSAQESLESHLMVFAAEESRITRMKTRMDAFF
jgi:predicted dehydrogenase